MARRCEVCSTLVAMRSDPVIDGGPIRSVLIEDRVVSLCGVHADEFLGAGLETLAELRAHFAEAGGKRSLVPRRATLDRRIFPARPEGRRLGTGRREGERAQ
jgi:hypothetical protein